MVSQAIAAEPVLSTASLRGEAGGRVMGVRQTVSPDGRALESHFGPFEAREAYEWLLGELHPPIIMTTQVSHQ